MPDHREKRVDLILQQLEELPTLPAIAIRVLEVTGDEHAGAREVQHLIESDPDLTARILRLVDRGEVCSIERAAAPAFDAVRSAVLAIGVFQNFGPAGPPAHGLFNRDEFWKHSIAVGCCAELLAEAARAPGVTPCEAFICGLLHDLGKVALDTILPKSFGRVIEAVDMLRGNIADVERSVIGIDHMVAGKRLAEKWRFPASIRDCIWLHGQNPRALPATVKNARMVNIVTLADQIVREQHFGYSGNYCFDLPRAVLLQGAGVTDSTVASVIEKLPGRVEPRARALGLGCASTVELFQGALARANKELGRISGQLAAKSRKLAERAECLEAMHRFQSDLRPDATPQAVLQAVAQAAVSMLGIECAAAFSLPPAWKYAQTVICDARGVIVETSLIDAPGAAAGDSRNDASADDPAPGCLSPSRVGQGPIRAAETELAWFVAMVSPRLAGDYRYWICLEADGQCVGGVVWGAQASESQRLASHCGEIAALAATWSLALRTAQFREEARALAEQLAEANRSLQAAQSEILRSRTMMSVGEMAAGAAHEMNNPLAVISGRSQLLAQQLSDPRLKAAANLVYEQSHRLSGIITEMMAFARPQTAIIEPVDITEVIDLAVREAKTRSNPADRRIEVTIGEAPWVAVDREQISAALAEVIENAIHATAEKIGRIEIHAGYDPYSSRVAISVTDNGCGMDENTVKRAFDPFFSAKPAGRRRGLGLAKALRWIESSGGSIRLESRPGRGTCGVMLLPALAHAAPVRNDADARAS
ncbi:MAG TPA: HDOD domain-containing protein [Tepidisphaeraceae bacterium]|jgi:signal transduction histidine kinase/HD-like signal output (HDOD) protein|nr:HDOD domain-containing protein [Tepidisphaeraceae bacterium]